jgi:hypothetical protein
VSYIAVGKVLYLDDDTIRYCYQLYGEKGLNWLADFGYKNRACELTAIQQEAYATYNDFCHSGPALPAPGCRKTGPSSAIQLPTISAPSTPQSSGSQAKVYNGHVGKKLCYTHTAEAMSI